MTTANTPTPAAQITWRVPAWAWLPISIAIVAEASINALRAYALGTHLEHFTINAGAFGKVSVSGAVLVLAAIAISLAQSKSAWVAFQPGAMARQRMVAMPIALLLLAVSVTAMASTLLEAQRSKSADESGQRSAYDRASDAYAAAKAELDALGNPRPVAMIQADVKNFKIDWPLWNRSKQCDDASKPDTQEYCDPLLKLYKERGAAARKTELAPEVARLKAALDALPRPELASASEQTVSGVWPWLVGLAAVLVATFGSVLFARPDVSTSASANRPAWETDTAGQSDYPAGGLFRNHPALLANRPDDPDRPTGGLATLPNRPTKPSAPNGSALKMPNGSEAQRRSNVLAFIRQEARVSGSIESQARLAELTGEPTSTLSEWLAEFEAAGLIERRVEGRCKTISIPTRELEMA